MPRGGPLCRKVFCECAERIGGGPCVGRRLLCREEAICAGRSPVLKGFKEAPVSRGDSLCRMVLLLYAEGIEGGPYAERRPRAAQRRPLCREEALCTERYSVLRRLVEAPVSGGGPCAERRSSVLVGPVLCAKRIEGGPCVGRRFTVPNGPTPLC